MVKDVGSTDSAFIFSTDKSPAYAGRVGTIRLTGNSASNVAATGGYALYVRAPGAISKGTVFMDGNQSAGYVTHHLIQDCRLVLRGGNVTTGGTALSADGGSIVQSRGNSSGAAFFGKATLAAGTVTVTTSEVKAGDTVIATRIGALGTLGDISVNAIVNGSFRVDSSSNLETSTVFWEVVH
ncbi:hypothetical protein D3C77_516580 [compost metagenome]